MDVNQAAIKRNGIQDFLSLRATGIIMTAYVLCIIGIFMTNDNIDYQTWKAIFSAIPMKVFTLITLGCVSVHARIGMWQVATDYIKNAQARIVLAFVVNLLSLAYVATGLFVLWGA